MPAVPDDIPRHQPLLVETLSWARGAPHLVLSNPLEHDRRTLPLTGSHLAFHVDAAGRFCIGARIDTGGRSEHQPCDGSRLATNGRQCERCARRDTSRFMHHAHRGGHVPDSMRAALAQPHWLYVATFADGAHKVGTATDARKRVRLDEQGAVRATYVAHTDDGLAVRVLEDAVTEHVGVSQSKHKSSKAAALTRALPATTLDAMHAECVAAVEAHLRTEGVGANAMPHETWQPPALHDTFFTTDRGIHPVYPHALTDGAHCLTPVAVVGSVALVEVNTTGSTASDPSPGPVTSPEGSLMLVDLDALSGRRIMLDDDARSPEVASQHSLF